MDIIPVKTEYNFEIINHTARATLEHIAGVRKVEYYFDDKLIGGRTIPEGELTTDDDCISEILEEYTQNNVGVYTDIYKHHSDKIDLVNKIVEVQVDIGACIADVHVKCERGCYLISMSTNGGKDKVVCQMEATDFSEVFEKLRIMLFGLRDMNTELSKHINELSNDRIMEVIKWKEEK